MDNLPNQSKPMHCTAHGAYESRHVFGVWTSCPKCANDLNARDEAAKVQQRADEARDAAQREWARKIGVAGIPPRFQDRSLDDFAVTTESQRVALRFSKEYVRDFSDKLAQGTSAIFVGPPGTGKTHLSCAIGQAIMHDQGRTVLFMDVMRAVRRIKETWDKDRRTETETEAINAMVFPDLLILDEVGVQFGSKAEELLLFNIINGRYENRKPTFLLSNESPEAIKTYLGFRAFDRLREGGGALVVLDGESARGRL